MSVTVTTKDLILIEWGNTCDIDNILYQKGFLQQLYLETDIGKPLYEIDEVGSTDGDNNFKRTWQKWEKKYKFQVLVPEFIIEALSMIKMHDYISIFLPNSQSVRVKDFEIENITWQEEGCMALVGCEFTTDYILNSGCCTNINLM